MTPTSIDKSGLLAAVKRHRPSLIKWRRHLHQIPETANLEFRTTAYLRQELKKLGLKLLPLKMKTGVLAELVGSHRGPTLAIRSDIDALPVPERTGLPYASKTPGQMHACGHDAHMAIVLGTAALLAKRKSDLRGKVRFIFQPSEEAPPGGAIPMIAGGALKGVSRIFGLHVDPTIAVGKIGLCDGPMMASVYDFDLVIKGKGGHAARANLAVDAITVAAEVIGSLQKIVSRETDPSTPIAISFGQIEGGRARNVVADQVTLKGTARTLSPATAKTLPGSIRRVVGSVCRAHKASFHIDEKPSYPILINDPATNQLYADTFRALFGVKSVTICQPVLGGEDFAAYLQKVPGAMLRLGVKNSKIGANLPWHSSEFKIDEEALVFGTALMVGSAMKFMAGGK